MNPLLAILAMIVSLCRVTALAAPGDKQPEHVQVNQLPPRLIATVKKKFPKAEILSAEQAPYTPAMMDCESWGVKVKEGNQELDVGVDSISGSYQVNMIAKPMAVADLPKPVIETFKTKYPQATLKSAREVLRGLMALPPGKTKPPDYELSIVTADNQSLLVCFTPELKTDSQGNTVPNSEKMVFSWESPSKNGPQ